MADLMEMESHDNMTLDMLEIDVNYTDNRDLVTLNNDKAFVLLPVVVYVIVLMVCGLVGNSFVCYIYRCRFRRNTSNFFIVFLAIMDLFCCCVGMSFELSDLLLPYLFNAPAACKIFRFIETWASGASGLVLVCVALDRYYKLCKPTERFSLKRAKIFCCVAIFIALVMAVPSLIVFGKRSVETEVPGINGTECSTDDEMLDSPLRIVFYVTMSVTFLVSLICLITLYSLIGFNLWQRKHKKMGEKLKPKGDYPRTHRFVNSDSSSFSSLSDETKKTQGYVQSHVGIQKTDTMRQAKGYKPNQGMGHISLKTTRLTGIFFVLSVSFVVSFLPWILANVLKVTKAAFNPFSSDAMEVLYNFLVRSHFINSSVNPIIYSILNSQFRKECKVVFKRMFKTCKR
ncbi:orexin receptor type 2-like [Haliotis rufescens]|uniref:orexin receptor type 2-like n=1 Tax=Haliotis rufescens TaxID=6454 RepID=UPI001EB047D2|nr:orexin receptor type 2-like [Haliotis rufescens]XP_046359131.1 orexin receptor type 2-like [Haliotis rufescens]XP_046359132.1 orexin receptor type 2-like [Haliotis rufescens]